MNEQMPSWGHFTTMLLPALYALTLFGKAKINPRGAEFFIKMIIKFHLCECNGLNVWAPCWVNGLHREPVEQLAGPKWSSEKLILGLHSQNKQIRWKQNSFLWRKINIIWYHLYVESKKKNHTNKLIYKPETDWDTGNKFMITKERAG